MTDSDKILELLKNNGDSQHEYFIVHKNNPNIKNEIQNTLNSKRNIYVLQGTGLYKVYKGQLALYSTQLAKGPFPGLDSFFSDGMVLSIPKIPYKYLQEFIDLCVEVNNDCNSEIFAMLFYKDNNYEWVVPEQTIGGASVDLTTTGKNTISEYYNKGYLAVIEAHSHNTMDAFFSATDNKDKITIEPFDMVVGNVNLYNPSILIRYKTDVGFTNISVESLFESAPQKNILPEYFRGWKTKATKEIAKKNISTNTYGNKTYSGYNPITGKWDYSDAEDYYKEHSLKDTIDRVNKYDELITDLDDNDSANTSDLIGYFDENDTYKSVDSTRKKYRSK